MALTGLAIAAALSLAKTKAVDEPKEARDRKLAAETQRLSPWTHLKADPVQENNAVGQMMMYGAAGAQMGANIKKSNSEAGLYDSAASSLNKTSGGAPGSNALGGQDMSAKLGAQSNNFQSKQPAWFFGHEGQSPPTTKPIGPMQGYQPDSTNAYKSLYDSGLSPDAQNFWASARGGN